MGSVRLEESGEWSGGVPECRTAHAAHQQRVERGGRRPAAGLSRLRFKAAKRILVRTGPQRSWEEDRRKRRGAGRLCIPPGAPLRRGGVVGG